MPPSRQHAVTTVVSTQVRSHDERTILVETGGFHPTRWFLDRGSGTDLEAAEPPKKRRKVTAKDQHDHRLDAPLIPLFTATIDLHFPEGLNSTAASEDAILNDVDFENAPSTAVVPYGVESGDNGTRLHLSYPVGKKPVLVVELAVVANEVLEALRKTAPSAQVRSYYPGHGISNCHGIVENPASVVSCTLTRSVGVLFNVVRLQASICWRSGVSAFPAGAPVGRYKVYGDYEWLLRAYKDHAREGFDDSQPWSPQDFYESKRAVSWMLEREVAKSAAFQARSLAPAPELWAPVQDVNGERCYVNHLQGIISRGKPQDEASQLYGGLLAEEMGLGKTVELMALISLNPRSVLPTERVFDEPSGTYVTRSSATLIITPTTILHQWQSELRRHAPKLRVYYYQGIPTGSKEAQSEESLVDELANSYDVVLATYTTLAREVHFAQDPPDRNMRHTRKFDRKRSPLVQLKWWRICLDEPRWSRVVSPPRHVSLVDFLVSTAGQSSGTPLRKNIQDLQGLLIFLRYKPFSDDAKLWGHLVQNHRHMFRQIFRHIALRHTKAQVRDELRLPSQKRVVVTVPFSVVEQQNYTTLFEEMCDDIGLNVDGSPKREDWDPSDGRITEAMRAWLVRLRQTCLHPQVGVKNRRALGRGSGPLRTVAEVLEVMIEQNETNLRAEERVLVQASLTRAHILGNNGEDEHRAEKAQIIYEAATASTARMLEDARQKLAAVKADVVAIGEVTEETEDDEDSSSESTPILGRLRNNVRIALQLHHTTTFFTATSYFQIKTNQALTVADSEISKELEVKETTLYETAKTLRKELLQDTARKAEASMRKIRDLETKHTMTKMPRIRDLESLGGIESRRIVEKSDGLFDIIREQVDVVQKWRTKMGEFLLNPLVDEESEGIETTGDEYEDSTKQQDELYVYFDAIKALHADLNTFITGESAPLVDHEVKAIVRDAKWFLYPEVNDDQKPMGVHAPELALQLFAVRNKFRSRRDAVGSVRSLIQEARVLETSMSWNDTGTRAVAERAIVQQHLRALQAVFSAYTKALTGLEKEVELFRSTQNKRVEFYRQLQEVSDDVSPYKDDLDPQLDQQALGVAMHREEHASSAVAQLKTKSRFLMHLREESGAQAGPRICIICTSPFERGVLTVCGHQFCKECILAWHQQARSCPVCKRYLTNNDMHDITFKPQELKAHEEMASASASSQDSYTDTPTTLTSLYTDVDARIMEEIKSIDLPSSYGTKIDTLAKHLHWIREHDPGAKSIVFSQYREFLDVLGGALKDFKLGCARLGRSGAVEKFRHDPSIDCLLLDAKTNSSGLTLVNATHVFVCEPLIQTAVELQAIARVHRIGQTRPTTVWMYLISDTVEEAIYEISVARRLAHVQSRQQQQQSLRNAKSSSSTPAPLLQETAIDAANSEELQAAPLSKLLVAGKGGGELVGNEDLWQCLFGKAQKTATATSAIAEREVGRHLRAEAAEQRRV